MDRRNRIREIYAWDAAGRFGMTDTRGFALEVDDFDYVMGGRS